MLLLAVVTEKPASRKEQSESSRINEALLFSDEIDPDPQSLFRYCEALEDVDASQLSKTERRKLAHNIGQRFEKQARYLRNGFSRVVRCEQLMTTLQQVAPKRFANIQDEYAKVLREAVADYQTEIAGKLNLSSLAEADLANLDIVGRALYELLAETKTEEASAALEEAIADIEQRVRGKREDFHGYIRQRIERSKDIRSVKPEPEELDRLRKLAQLASDKVTFDGGQCTVREKGKTWRLKPFGDGPEGPMLSVVSAQTSQKLVTVSFRRLSEALERDRFNEITQQAEENFEREQAGREELARYELPKDDPVAYLRVLPRNFDPMVSANLQTSMVLAETLQQQFPKLEAPSPTFTHTPIETLKESIRPRYADGTRTFCLDLYEHGTRQSIDFRESVTAEKLVTLMHTFPEAQFQIRSIACHGGGLREGFQKAFRERPGLKDRVTVFLQSKPETPNFAARQVDSKDSDLRDILGQTDDFGTFYDLFLIHGLLQGKTYGEAVIDADEGTKRRTRVDPETLLHGKLITHRTDILFNERFS